MSQESGMFLAQLPSGDFGILKVDYPRVPPEQENNTGISGNREIPGFTRIPFSRRWNYPRSPFKTPNPRQTSRKPQFGGFNTNSIAPSVPAALSRGEQGNSRPCRGILDFFFFLPSERIFPRFPADFPRFQCADGRAPVRGGGAGSGQRQILRILQIPLQ